MFRIFHNKKFLKYVISSSFKIIHVHASLPCSPINSLSFFNHVLISPHFNSPTYLTTVTNICIPSSQTMGIIPHMHTLPHGGVTANPSFSQPTRKDFIFIGMVFFHPLHYTSLLLPQHCLFQFPYPSLETNHTP